jgi:hypothetical protein
MRTDCGAVFPTLLAAAAVIGLLVAPAAAADTPIKPDPQLTPGAVASTDDKLICQPGYAKSVRHTAGNLKALVYREYHIDRRSGHYEIDHLIPLSLGGADLRANLWPESFDTRPWNAERKDRLEVFFRIEVCAGRMPIERAQAEIAKDWIAAYQRYLGEP